MRCSRISGLGGMLLLLVGVALRPASAALDDPPDPQPPADAVQIGPNLPLDALPDPAVPGAPEADAAALVLQTDTKGPVRPLVEGPLHEAFLSPARDAEPEHIAKEPPPPITERPG